MSGNVGFVVGKVVLGQVFSEYFGFPYQLSFHHTLYNPVSPGAGTIGQLVVVGVPNGLNLTPHHENNKRKGVLDRKLYVGPRHSSSG
jgi:hypothetical protein